MHVEIVSFPQTRVASIAHRGSPSSEHETARKLIAWKLEHGLTDQDRYRNFGVHHAARTLDPRDHHVDFCLSIDFDVESNPYGIVNAFIPRLRCARARHLGSRAYNSTADYLYTTWLPVSGEVPGDFPLFFHYVNVGPRVQESEMITDVYLPLK